MRRPSRDRDEVEVRSVKMQFILKGFIPDTAFRVFTFEGIAEDRTRTEFKVKTDLSLIRKYGIRIQDLPLLCRGLLERRGEGEQAGTLTFTEEEMRIHAKSREAADREAAEKRKSRHTPTSPRAWGQLAASTAAAMIPAAKS
jgi:hypothetical protein